MFPIPFVSMLLDAVHSEHYFLGLMESLPGGERTAIFITHFFTDAVNIFLILFFVMFCVFFLQTFVNMDRLRDRMAGLKSGWVYVLAIFMGALSPFCSCSIVPVLMGLIAVGVPLPVCLCMLTSASLVNVTALTAMYSLTDVGFAAVYTVCALTIIGVSSLILSRLNFANGCREYGLAHCHGHEHDLENGTDEESKFVGRAKLALHSTWHLIKGAWFYIVLGVALSAGVEAYLPLETIGEFISSNTVAAITAATLIGLPIHSDVFTIMPLLRLLRDIYPPVSMAFTLATMVISVPGIILLSRVLKPKVIGIYVGVLAGLTLICGYVLIPFMSL